MTCIHSLKEIYEWTIKQKKTHSYSIRICSYSTFIVHVYGLFASNYMYKYIPSLAFMLCSTLPVIDWYTCLSLHLHPINFLLPVIYIYPNVNTVYMFWYHVLVHVLLASSTGDLSNGSWYTGTTLHKHEGVDPLFVFFGFSSCFETINK